MCILWITCLTFRNLDSMCFFFTTYWVVFYIYCTFLRSENSENSLRDGLWEEVNICSCGGIFPEQPRGSGVMAALCLLPALRPASNRVVCRLCHFPTTYDDPLLWTCQEAFRSWEFGKVGKRLHWEKAQTPGPSGGPWCLDRLESLSFLEPCRLLHDSRVLSVLLALGWAKAMSWLWNLRVTEGKYKNDYEKKKKNDYAVAAVYSLSRVWLSATPRTVACQAPLRFSRRKYWSGLPFPSPGDLPDPEIEPASPAWQADSSPLSNQGSSRMAIVSIYLLSGCSVLGTVAGIYILYISYLM